MSVTEQRADFFGIFTEFPDSVHPPRTFQDFLPDAFTEMMADALTLAPFFAVTMGFTKTLGIDAAEASDSGATVMLYTSTGFRP